MKYYFAFHFLRRFSNWSSNRRKQLQNFEVRVFRRWEMFTNFIWEYLRIYFSKNLFFVFLLLLSQVMFLQFMGVETNHNLFRTFLNFTISGPHVCSRILIALALPKIQDQLVGSTADESLKIATKQLSGVVRGV